MIDIKSNRTKYVPMNGTFNGIPIEKVFAMKISPRTTGSASTRFPRPELEEQFALKSCASVKVSVYEFEGQVVRYDRAVPAGVYEVTIKGKNSQRLPFADIREQAWFYGAIIAQPRSKLASNFPSVRT